MPTCSVCGGEFRAGDLVRHETDRLLLVHCPDCESPLGRYRRHGQRP